MRTPVSAALVAALSFTPPAHAANDADLAEIRAQVKQMKVAYEQRIAALESRLAEAEKNAVKAERTAAKAEAGVVHSAAAAAPIATATTSASAFNPAIYAVLQGVSANLSQDPNKYVISGFVPSGDIAPAKRGFSIAESELGFSANVDDKIYANLILSLSPENSVEVEEAYGVLTALPGGLRPKSGRFLSSIGYLNDQHQQHGWDFYDAPLPCQGIRGTIGDTPDGAQAPAGSVAARRRRLRDRPDAIYHARPADRAGHRLGPGRPGLAPARNHRQKGRDGRWAGPGDRSYAGVNGSDRRQPDAWIFLQP